MSRLESGIRITLKFYEAFNHHDVAGMMQLMSDDCIFEHSEHAPDGVVYSGKKAVARFWQDFFLESPHAHIEIEEIFGFGFRCVARWRYDWEDAEGTEGYIRGVDIFRIKKGSICGMFSYIKG